MTSAIMSALVALLGGLGSAIIGWLSMFGRQPLRASLRALVAIFGVLVAGLPLPSIEAETKVTVDWAPVITVNGELVRFSTAVPTELIVVAFVTTTLLITICLIRVSPE